MDSMEAMEATLMSGASGSNGEAATGVSPAAGRAGAQIGHPDFYRALIARNQLLISPELQQRLRSSRFLVAGCGAIGSSAVEPLVRVGAEKIVVAEPDAYDLSNLNRQLARLEDVGVNKAVAVARQMRAISPYARIEVLSRGITAENVDYALNGTELVFDGVDVTGIAPLRAKFLLHSAARAKGIPVISGYDIAGLQLLVVYRYDDPRTKLLHGAVTIEDFDGPREFRPVDFLFKVIPLRYVPYEIFPAIRKMLAGEEFGFPQVVYTAKSFGTMALGVTLGILAGEKTRKYVSFDHHAAGRTWLGRARIQAKRLVGLTQLLVHYFKSRG
jgi:hypothetical protein